MGKNQKVIMHGRSRKVVLKVFQALFVALGIFTLLGSSASATYSAYGSGAYGECLYGEEGSTCSISITNNNPNGFYLNLNITPSHNGSCTIKSDVVEVITNDPNGYTLTLGDQSTSSNLKDASGDTIIADSGTESSPSTLSNDWGYRVDGLSSKYSNTTGSETNGAQSTENFAGIENSNNTPDTIASTSTYNGSGGYTTVWYGICLNYSSIAPPGLYSSTVIYTATAN